MQSPTKPNVGPADGSEDFVETADAAIGTYLGRSRDPALCPHSNPPAAKRRVPKEAGDSSTPLSWRDRLISYARGKLSADERALVREHIHDCTRCYDTVIETVRQGAGATAPADPGRPTATRTPAAAAGDGVARPPSRERLVERFVSTYVAGALATIQADAQSTLAKLRDALEAIRDARWEVACGGLDGLLRNPGGIDAPTIHTARGAALLGRADYAAAQHAFEKALHGGTGAERAIGEIGVDLARFCGKPSPSIDAAAELDSRIGRLGGIGRGAGE